MTGGDEAPGGGGGRGFRLLSCPEYLEGRPRYFGQNVYYNVHHNCFHSHRT